tara:strand:- start:39 stop:485 length:447 start_codon:yes stop_codon:yes gene_type:complete
MANVNIKFNNKEFLLSCEDGQEEHLEELSLHLNEKFDKLKSSLGNIGENKLLLITSITTMDEYFETKKKINQKAKELNILTEKFKELKSLVYEYKDKKEREINNLSEEQTKMKNQLDENRLEYEKVIEKAANQIENFLTKIDSENSIQ